jgi:rare lipoprotein A
MTFEWDVNPNLPNPKWFIPIIIAFVVIFFFITSAFAETGIASLYGNGEKLNKHTANREVFNPKAMTCATYNYPFNTLLKVTNLKNNKFVIVRVNDRGPNKRLGRVIDLTVGAFKKIAVVDKGLITVKIEVER